MNGADVVVNLAGRSVNCRYNAINRRLIVDSRVNSTRVLSEAIATAHRPPRVWLQASTATIYAHRYDAPNDEATGILGGNEAAAPATWRFSIDVATAWEQAANDANVPATRKVLLRSAMTMSPDRGGIFDTLLGLVRRGLGGTSGDGRQYVSWIHERDFVRAVYWLIDHDEIAGPVNVAAPHPLPNAEFMRALRDAWGTRIGLPATQWMLEIGAVFLRTETELILKSRRVVPGRLLESGFTFEFPTWPEAAADLCRRLATRLRAKPQVVDRPGRLLVAVEIDVDQEIAAQEIAAQQERVRHPLPVAERHRHMLLEVLPAELEPHLVTLVVVGRGADRHVVDDLRADPLLLAVRVLEQDPHALADVVRGPLGRVFDFQLLVVNRADASSGVDAGREGKPRTDFGHGCRGANPVNRGLRDVGDDCRGSVGYCDVRCGGLCGRSGRFRRFGGRIGPCEGEEVEPK